MSSPTAIVASNPASNSAGDAKSPATSPGPRCLSRRLWEAGKKWGESLIHLVWFWRAAMLALLIVAGVFAWNEPDFQERVAATGLLFGLGALLVLDMLVAFLNLPLLLYYTTLWLVLTLAAVVDLLFYFRYLRLKHNRIALWVLLANVALIAAIFFIWSAFKTPLEQGETAEPVAILQAAPGQI